MGRLGYVYYKDEYAGYIQELDIGYNFTYDSASSAIVEFSDGENA